MTASRAIVRQICQRCQKIDRAPFMTPSREMWQRVAGPHWEHAILCLDCYAELGDEKGIEWDAAGIEIETAPYVRFTSWRAWRAAAVSQGYMERAR